MFKTQLQNIASNPTHSRHQGQEKARLNNSKITAYRRTVETRSDDGRVVVGFVRGAAKINHHNVRALDHA
jgi:hypothetical protein